MVKSIPLPTLSKFGLLKQSIDRRLGMGYPINTERGRLHGLRSVRSMNRAIFSSNTVNVLG